MWRSISALLIAAGLLGVVVTPVRGQGVDTRTSRVEEGWRYFDYFVTRYELAGSAGGQKLDGVGGRVMWQLAPLMGAPRQGWKARTLVGGYLVHTPRDPEEMEVWRYGTQADLRLAPAALPRWLDPFVSLGVGAVRVEEANRSTVPGVLRRVAPTDIPQRGEVLIEWPGISERRSTSLSVTPGVGARLRLFPGLDLRGDARQVLDFRSRMRSNFEVAGGLSLYL